MLAIFSVFGIRSLGLVKYDINPVLCASSGRTFSPEYDHSNAFDIPTIFGRNQLEQASGAIPLLANGKLKLALVEAILISAASCSVAPTPTAGPLHAMSIG